MAGLGFADICDTCGIMKSGSCPLKCSTEQTDPKKTVKESPKKAAKKTIKKNANLPKYHDAVGVKVAKNEIPADKGLNIAKQSTIENIYDASITARVKVALLFHRTTSAVNSRVSTNNGLVTLSGSVSNNEEKALAGKLAKNIKGVTGVVNNMIIKPCIGGQDAGKSTIDDDACGNEKEGANACKIK